MENSSLDIDSFLDEILQSFESVESEEQALSPKDKRDAEYTHLVSAYVEHYTKKSKTNRILKVVFFGIILTLLVVLILGCISVSILACILIEDSVTILTTLVSSLVGAISSILILPTIICNYLFPKDEDKYIGDLIVHFKDSDKDQ